MEADCRWAGGANMRTDESGLENAVCAPGSAGQQGSLTGFRGSRRYKLPGKTLDVGVALRGRVQDRVTQTVETFVGHAPSGHVRIEKSTGSSSSTARRSIRRETRREQTSRWRKPQLSSQPNGLVECN